MMLRLFLLLLNPYRKGLLRKKPTLLQQSRIWVYRTIIMMLKNYYRRYSYLDVIHLGDVEIRQSRRDLEFEKWLSQLKIDIRPHFYSASKMPQRTTPYWWRPFYKFFHMEIVTMIVRDKKEIILNRTHSLTINSNMKGYLKLSDKNDILQRSEFKAVTSRPKTDRIPVRPVFKRKVSLGEAGPITPPLREPEKPEVQIQVEPPKIIQIQGAEIDESF